MVAWKYLGFVLSVVLLACQKSEYHQLVTRELASGERHDELLLDLEFGMSPDSFFVQCFRLNKQGLVHQGMRNNTVEYPLPDTTAKGPARLNFYPEFHDGKLYKMPVTFRYDRWAPRKEEMRVENIVPDVIAMLESWHDTDFIEFGNAEKGTGWVAVAPAR